MSKISVHKGAQQDLEPRSTTHKKKRGLTRPKAYDDAELSWFQMQMMQMTQMIVKGLRSFLHGYLIALSGLMASVLPGHCILCARSLAASMTMTRSRTDAQRCWDP